MLVIESRQPGLRLLYSTSSANFFQGEGAAATYPAFKPDRLVELDATYEVADGLSHRLSPFYNITCEQPESRLHRQKQVTEYGLEDGASHDIDSADFYQTEERAKLWE